MTVDTRRADCAKLRERIGEIAALKRRYGYGRIDIKLATAETSA